MSVRDLSEMIEKEEGTGNLRWNQEALYENSADERWGDSYRISSTTNQRGMDFVR
jgi:hypothetical protein